MCMSVERERGEERERERERGKREREKERGRESMRQTYVAKARDKATIKQKMRSNYDVKCFLRLKASQS